VWNGHGNGINRKNSWKLTCKSKALRELHFRAKDVKPSLETLEHQIKPNLWRLGKPSPSEDKPASDKQTDSRSLSSSAVRFLPWRKQRNSMGTEMKMQMQKWNEMKLLNGRVGGEWRGVRRCRGFWDWRSGWGGGRGRGERRRFGGWLGFGVRGGTSGGRRGSRRRGWT